MKHLALLLPFALATTLLYAQKTTTLQDSILSDAPILSEQEIAALSASSEDEDEYGFTWSVGTDLTSSYLYHGHNIGALSLQPDAMVGYGGAFLELWGNIGAYDYSFKEFAPELDIVLGFSRWGLTIQYTHLYYFDGSGFFAYKNPTIEQLTAEDYNTTEGKVKIEYQNEQYPFLISVETDVAGNDAYIDTLSGNVRRAFSTYIELGYDFSLPYDLSLGFRVGMTPSWRQGMSKYTDFDGSKFAVVDLALRLERDFQVADFCTINVFAEGHMNPHGINKENAVLSLSDRRSGTDIYEQRLNACIGFGVWFE